MSHFTKIACQISDIDVLGSTCSEMGLELVANAEARGIGTQQKGDYVIRLKGPCDIALNRETSGTFSLSTDWWDGHVEKEVGPNFGRLLQLYAVQKATREARQRGLSVQRRNRQDGTIQLTIGGVS